MNENDSSKSPSSYEDFINENMLKNSQQQINSECDTKKFKADFDDNVKSSSEVRHDKDVHDESESESESEIDLTTTGSPKNFVLVNGCIDFSNNNNNNNCEK